MDNFFSTTPVLSCARSMFMATDGVVYEASNVTRGLETMQAMPRWPEWRKDRQRQLACWYESVSMSSRKSASENIRVMDYHFRAYARDPAGAGGGGGRRKRGMGARGTRGSMR